MEDLEQVLAAFEELDPSQVMHEFAGTEPLSALAVEVDAVLDWASGTKATQTREGVSVDDGLFTYLFADDALLRLNPLMRSALELLGGEFADRRELPADFVSVFDEATRRNGSYMATVAYALIRRGLTALKAAVQAAIARRQGATAT